MSKRAALLIAIVALASGLGLWASMRMHGPAAAPPPAVQAVTLMQPPRELPLFELQQSDGTPLTRDELKGHWTLVFLGFTTCPDICPTTLMDLAAAQNSWRALPDTTRPRLLLISVDPERDTPARLGEYAHAFHADTLAATGDIPALEKFATSLGFVFRKAEGEQFETNPEDYSVDHSASLAVLDPQGRLAGLIRPPFDAAAIAADLTELTGTTAP